MGPVDLLPHLCLRKWPGILVLERAERETSSLKKKAKSYARSLQISSGKICEILFQGEREIFCQRSVNTRNTCLIAFRSRPIPGERRSCDTLPSKQAVAGSSPVSRSLSETVFLQTLERLLQEKRAVKALGQDGSLLPQKLFNGHLPSLSGKYLPRVSPSDKSVRYLA